MPLSEEDSMAHSIDITGKAAVIVGLLVIALVAVRIISFSDSHDAALEDAVRAELWLRYGGQLDSEINKIREGGDYSSVDSLLKKATPDAITIERISRSEPLLSGSTNQKVVVRVHYRYPDDTETRMEYMKFKHGMVGGWRYNPEGATVVSFYLNFF